MSVSAHFAYSEFIWNSGHKLEAEPMCKISGLFMMMQQEESVEHKCKLVEVVQPAVMSMAEK